MLTRIAHLIVILFFFSAEITVGQWLGYWSPHLVLAGIVAFALADDQLDSLVWVVVGGLLLDFASGQFSGLQLFLFSLIAGSLIFLSGRFFQRPNPGLALLASLIASLGYELCLNLVYGQVHWQLILPAISTAVIAVLIYSYNLAVTKQREVIHFA